MSGKDEAARDQQESAFTPILRRLVDEEDGVRCVVFVDRDGECIDYCSVIDPFEAKVIGAHLQVLVQRIREAPRWPGGEPVGVQVYASELELHVRRLHDEYVLVVASRHGATTRRLLSGIERVTEALRAEAGIARSAWDPFLGVVAVESRPAVGWDYAPTAYWDEGRRIELLAVLGRWVDRDEIPGVELVCFRVRTEAGAEVTLAHHAARGRWVLR